MRKLLIALLAVMLAMSWVTVKSAQAASIIKTEDGLEFKFGLVEKVQFYTLQGADFTQNVPACTGLGKSSKGECNFRQFISPDSAVGDTGMNIFNFTNLLFDLSKGPVSIHINLENEARMDENNVDVNHLNLERAALTWKTGVIGDLTVGFDVHLFDPEGGLIYQDEDPGIWLVGSQGILSWNVGYHKRLSRNGGIPLGQLGATFPPPLPSTGLVRKLDVDSDIFEGRLGFNFPLPGGNLSVSPMVLALIRHTASEFGPVNLASCPTGGCTGMPLTSAGRGEIYYPAVVASAKLGPLSFTVEGAGMLGEMRELGASFQDLNGGKGKYDIEAWAVFAEVALDLSAQGIGLTPYVNLDYRSGDDNPYDNTLGGYSAQSDLTQALRKDGFRHQSIQSLGAGMLGNGGDDGWGFNTSGRGIGPSLGTILEGLGGDSLYFNSRWGKGDNPGMIKISGGALGKINSQWDTHVGVSYIRFETTESIKAEAAMNRDARGVIPATTCAAFPKATNQNKAARVKCIADTLSVDEDAAVEFNFNVGWSPVPALRIQPFVSVMVPLGGADDIQRLFLDATGDTRIAYTAGVEFRAQF